MKHSYSYRDMFKTRPTKVEINLGNLTHNLSVVKNLVGERKIMGIVKADAYGHGIVEISKILEEESIDYLGTAYIEEAILLRKNNIKVPLLVLGAVNSWQIEDFFKYDIEFTGSSLEKLQEISIKAGELKKKARVHIKIDTGMGRIGVQWDRVKPFFKEIFKLNNIDLVGIFTHFSSANSDREYTDLQTERFDSVLKELSKYVNIDKLLIHSANSAAISNNKRNTFRNMVRSGLLLYGYSYNKEIQKKLKPVMIFKTVVSYFKVLEKGSSISYDRKYITPKQTRIITLPVGYADGYIKEFSNKAFVYLGKNRYPVVGNICMDQCMVDIGKGEAFNGDTVELWGGNIRLWDLCKVSNKTPYELLTGISQRVAREYIN